MLLCCAAWGQKRTVDPVRNDYVYVVRFDRIETTKERTVAEVTLRNDPASWIRYDTGCYLRERGGDRRYRLLAAEGFELGKEVFLPAPGVSKARFVFEPLDADVRCVDFLGRQKPLENTYGIWLKDAPSPLPASFYDFVTMERVDDPLMITTSDANSVISRLVVCSPVMNIGRIADAFSAFSGLFGPGLIAHIAGKVREGCPDLTPGQRAELDSLPFKSRGESVSIRDTMISRRFGACLKEFNAQRAKEQARLDTLREKYMYANAFDTLRRYGLDRCLAYDYALTGYFYSLVSQQQQNENFRLDLFAEMTRLLPYVGTPYLTGRIVRAYEEASSVVIRPVEKDEPRTKADDYFDELIAPYRGYVLYIDFWGTGCAPCRQGMVEARQTVEELKDSKIKFLYITSEGISPLAAYDRFLSERRIQGERLRLSDDQWNLLCTKFDIYGIPHCVVVDKQGRVVDNNRWSRSGPALCKSKLLELEKQ